MKEIHLVYVCSHRFFSHFCTAIYRGAGDMKKISAGLIMYRKKENDIQVFLVHPGGPFFTNKDKGVWSVPKGEPDDDNEDLLDAACREFTEETSIEPNPPYIELGHIFQKNNKKVIAWGFEGDWPDDKPIESNRFMLEWPPKSGKKIEIPEVDKGEWFDISTAREKIIKEQFPLVEQLIEKVS